MSGHRKKVFDVDQYGSIDDCLKAMERAGYTPVARIEKPFFKEGPKGIEVAGRKISFEGIPVKHE